MRNVFKQIGIIALVAVVGFSFATLSLTGCGGGGGGGGGGEVETYTVEWDEGTPEWGFLPSLEVTFVGSHTGAQRQKIADAIKLTDIVMSPAGVITLDSVSDQTTRDCFRVNCTVLKSGTVKITLKPIAGFTFTKDRFGTDTITVTDGTSGGSGGNPAWPVEFGGAIHDETRDGTVWGKTSYPNTCYIAFDTPTDGDDTAAYMFFSGSSYQYELVKVDGKRIKVRDTESYYSSNEYTLCTDWTITGNYLTLSGGDSLFSSIMNTPLAKN